MRGYKDMMPLKHLVVAYLIQLAITWVLGIEDVKIYTKAQIITFTLVMLVYLALKLCLE